MVISPLPIIHFHQVKFQHADNCAAIKQKGSLLGSEYHNWKNNEKKKKEKLKKKKKEKKKKEKKGKKRKKKKKIFFLGGGQCRGVSLKMQYFRLGYFLLIWAPFYSYVPLIWLKIFGNPEYLTQIQPKF